MSHRSLTTPLKPPTYTSTAHTPAHTYNLSMWQTTGVDTMLPHLHFKHRMEREHLRCLAHNSSSTFQLHIYHTYLMHFLLYTPEIRFFLLALMVPQKFFNIHGTFSLHKRLFLMKELRKKKTKQLFETRLFTCWLTFRVQVCLSCNLWTGHLRQLIIMYFWT